MEGLLVLHPLSCAVLLPREVDTALKALQQNEAEGLDVDVNELEDLQLKKSLIAAAKALQVRKIEYSAVVEIVKNCQVLMLQGMKLGPEVELAVTKRRAVVSLGDGDLSGWLSCLSFSNPTGGWDPKSPSFGGILTQLAAMDEQDPSHIRFRETLVETIFNSAFQRAMNYLNQEGGNAELVTSMCSGFMKQWAREKDLVQLGGQEQAAIECAHRAIHGIHCLIGPLPFIFPSALEDVQYVSPKNATTAAIIQDLPKTGRLLVTKFRQEVAILVAESQ